MRRRSRFRLPSIGDVISAVPEALTAAFFLAVWAEPRFMGESAVRVAVLVVPFEFILIHASGLMGTLVLMTDLARRTRMAILGGAGLAYLAVVLVMVWAYGQWWPLPVFLWLLLGKLPPAFRGMGPMQDREAWAQVHFWAQSVKCYVLCVVLAALEVFPYLGMTPEVAAQFGLPRAMGVFVDRLHKVGGAGFLYFSLLAVVKLRVYRPALPHGLNPEGR